jgi:hypothetical protein
MNGSYGNGDSLLGQAAYCFECLCGHQIETEAKTLACPRCQRVIVIEWPAQERAVSTRNPSDQTAAA